MVIVAIIFAAVLTMLLMAACACCGISSCCPNALPASLHVTISGFTGACAIYNGTWAVTYTSSLPALCTGTGTAGWANTNFGGIGDVLLFWCCDISQLTPCQRFCLTGCFGASSPFCISGTMPSTAPFADAGGWDSCSCSPPSWSKAHGLPSGIESVSVTV